jgi:hypothetical protein
MLGENAKLSRFDMMRDANRYMDDIFSFLCIFLKHFDIKLVPFGVIKL